MANAHYKGLNKRRAKGKWYVSTRNGISLLKGFEGSKVDLERKLGSPEFRAIYDKATQPAKRYGEGSLGELISWYKQETHRYQKLSDRTKKDYEKCYSWLGEDLDYDLSSLTKVDIVNVRNKAAIEKWPRFADMLVSALSSVFSEGVEAGKVTDNICLGIKNVYKANPDANREWTLAEQKLVFEMAPMHLLRPMYLARYVGAREIDIHQLIWTDYAGGYMRLKASKNSVENYIPVLETEPLKSTLDKANRSSIFICTTSEGQPYKSESVLQQAVGKFLRQLAKDKLVAKGLTLHGLRVTFASEWRRMGFEDADIADLLGDKDATMGKHYTRHVGREVTIKRAFDAKKVVQLPAK